MKRTHLFVVVMVMAFGLVACSSSGRSPSGDGGGVDGGGGDGGGGLDGAADARRDGTSGLDGGTGDDGGRICGPDAGFDAGTSTGPGTCMDGVAVPGCPCSEVGATQPCRTGRMITCESLGEFGGEWGPCLGSCFSTGTWEIDNLSPCFITYSTGETYAVSTILSGGTAMCPSAGSVPPPAMPAEDWSTDRLTVDCEGQFELCYTLKAGDAESPSDADCVLAEVCVSGWYAAPNVTQELPPLGPWRSADTACAAQFASSGGYGEMSVIGTTLDCETIDDGTGDRYVFNRVNYCPLCCNSGECSGPMCDSCMMGGSGSF